MATPDQTNEPTVYRLTDIDTEEVSIVDRAANQRKFLIVKGANMAKAGAAVSSDGKGGHTATSKDAPATPPAPAAPAAAPAPAAPAAQAPAAAPPAAPAAAPAAGGPAAEPKLQLSPEAKAELVKRFTAAAERLAALKAMLDGAAEVPGLVEVPAEIATKVAELLTGIAQGEVEKGAPVAKGLPQFSSARTAQLQAAYDALGAVLGSVAKPVPAPAADPAAEPAGEPAVDAEVAKAFASLEAKVAAGLEKIAGVVAKQGEAIAKQAGIVEAVQKGSRPTPRSGAPEGARESVEKDDDDADAPGGWPADMSDPDKHDVSKVDPSLRFTVKPR